MLWSVRNIAAVAGAGVVLASCGMVDGRRDGRLPPPSRASARPVSDVPVKIGPPYSVRGVTYTPADDRDYEEVGYASWYGDELSGSPTANGERFRPGGVSAAHRTLPLPSYVEVTALDTGRTILVRINDRGPFSGNRLLDLSRGAAEQLGLSGAAPVRVRRVDPPESDRADLRAGGRAPPRETLSQSRLAVLRARLPQEQGVVRLASFAPVVPPPGRNGYMVQVAAFTSRDRARELADRIDADLTQAGSLWRVRYGPYDSESTARAALRRAQSKGFRDAAIMAND